jgi:hypothetical protein
MEMYKQAIKLDLRFQTSKGVLTPQQLFQLNQNDLANAIKAVKKVLKKNDDDELSFLEDSKVVDTENQLRFDILKDVYLTKKKEEQEIRDAYENKKHNQKIFEEMARRKEIKLTQISDEELERMIKK